MGAHQLLQTACGSSCDEYGYMQRRTVGGVKIVAGVVGCILLPSIIVALVLLMGGVMQAFGNLQIRPAGCGHPGNSRQH